MESTKEYLLQGASDSQYFSNLIKVLAMKGSDIPSDLIKGYIGTKTFSSKEDGMLYLILFLNQWTQAIDEFKTEYYERAKKTIETYINVMGLESVTAEMLEVISYGLLFKIYNFTDIMDTEMYYHLIDLCKSFTDSDNKLIQFCLYYICLAVTDDYVRNKLNQEEYPSEMLDIMVKARGYFEKIDAEWFN